MPPPSRNVADATRFAQNVRNPPPKGGETAQQRVARLREAHRRAKANKITTFDRVVHHGRIWADRLHRGVVFGIIGFSGVTAALLGYTMWDIVRHANRNKKEYRERLDIERVRGLADWRSREVSRLMDRGLEEDQAVKVFDEAELKRRAGKTAWGRLKTWAEGGLTPAEEEYSSKYELQEQRIKTQVIDQLQAEHLQIVLAKKKALEEAKGLEPSSANSSVQTSLSPPSNTTSTSISTAQNPPIDIMKEAEAAAAKVDVEAKGTWTSLKSWFGGTNST